MPKTKTKPKEDTNTDHDAALEKRVAALEAEMAVLKKQIAAETSVGSQPHPEAWRSTVGMFKDDPTFDEAVRLGRNWRRRQPKC